MTDGPMLDTADEDDAAVMHPAEVIVDEWFARWVSNSPASRVTEVWNYLATEAVPALKEKLKELKG